MQSVSNIKNIAINSDHHSTSASYSKEIDSAAGFLIAMPSYAIPGLHFQPTQADLQASNNAYNCLLDDEDQPTTKEHHLNKLAQLFVDYNAQKIFGLHLIHGHFRIPPNTVMLGTIFEGRFSCCWTKPSPFEAILSKPVHGHIYTFSPDHRLLPYEYRDGDVPKRVTDIDQAFFRELSEYLSSNKLAELLGLEVFDDIWSPQPQMSETVLAGQGTVMVKGEDVENAELYKVTWWCFAQDENGIVSVKGQEIHAAVNGEHQIFRDTKPLSNIDAVLDLLLQERIIKDSC